MKPNYIEIDFTIVKGYKKLSEPAKEVFQRVYKTHNSGQGLEYKKNWIPKSVKEYKTYLEVRFANGEWLHFRPNGTWD